MNNFGEKFEKIYLKTNFANVLKEKKIYVKGQAFNTLDFVPEKEIIDLCIEMAKEKAKYTMVENQNLKKRTDKEKIANAFRGILAETLVHIFLVSNCDIPFEQVKRFDLERESFKYSKLEYDLNIEKPTGEILRLECRSSQAWEKTKFQACESKPIIGQYVNGKKVAEKVSDLYSCVLFQYTQDFYDSEKPYLDKDKAKMNTIEDVINGNLRVYLPSGTDKEQMMGKDSKETNYGQKNTMYRVCPIVLAGDINTYINKLKKDIA